MNNLNNASPEIMMFEAGTQREQERAVRSKGVRSVSSDTLFRGAREIIIEHREQQYRLQVTKAGKLILNK